MEPFYREARATIAEFTPDFAVPDSVLDDGFKYFLGREEVLQLLTEIDSKLASKDTQAEFVIHYAVLDAYPSWYDDLSSK